MRRGMTARGVRAWKDFERQVVRELRKLAPGARRCLQFQRFHGAPDVAAGVLWVECKSGQHRPVERVYRETARKAKASKGTVPAVVSKAGARGPKLVTMALKDFLQIATATPLDKRRMWKGGQP
jgi:hypothetical protein